MAVVTVLCTPGDGCGWHPKHVEWTCRIINRLLCVASRRTIVDIDRRCTETQTWIREVNLHTFTRFSSKKLMCEVYFYKMQQARNKHASDNEVFENVCFVFGAKAPQWARASSFTRSLVHTQRRSVVGRTPLDEWSARRKDLYLTTHNAHNRQTSMTPVGLEPTIWAGERPLGPAFENIYLKFYEENIIIPKPRM